MLDWTHLTSPRESSFFMSSLRRFVVPAVLALSSATVMVACAQLDANADYDAGSFSSGEAGTSTGAGTGGQDASIVIEPDATPDGFNPAKPFEYLCAEGACIPGGDPSSCAPGEPGAGSSGSGGSGGNVGNGGSGGDDGSGGGGGSGGGSSGSTGSGGSGEPTSCKLVPGEMGAQAMCVVPGTKLAQQVCQTAADCADGLGCGATNLCLNYCCGLAEACPGQTYCAKAAIAEEPGAEPSVPLCVPVKDCALLDDDCDVTETCSIVREDGTTSCIPAGPGGTCDPCPCAQGFICSKGPNVCLKLCHTNRTDECGTGFCQGGASNYPSDIGVCVGGDADDCSP